MTPRQKLDLLLEKGIITEQQHQKARFFLIFVQTPKKEHRKIFKRIAEEIKANA